MKRIEPAHLQGEIKGFPISSSSIKQILQTGASDLLDLTYSSILGKFYFAFDFFMFFTGTVLKARYISRAFPVPAKSESMLF